MRVTVGEICRLMDAWAPPELACDWDKAGLHTGNPKTEVMGVLVCLTVTPEALRTAQQRGANLIIAHHPLIWEPLKSLRADDPQARLCVEIAAANIACFSAHTNLDKARGGVNDTLAERLGLQDCAPLLASDKGTFFKLVTFVPESHVDSLRDALAAAGAGVIGNYTHCSFHAPGTGSFTPNTLASPYSGIKEMLNHESELRFEMLVDRTVLAPVLQALQKAHPYEEPAYDLIPLANRDHTIGLGRLGVLNKSMKLGDFAELVRTTLGLPHVIRYGAPNRRVRHVAVLGGSGGSSISGLPEETDVFVSGDIGYHDAQTALMRGICCIDAGHAGTELPVLNIIRMRLRQAWKKLPVFIFREKPFGTVHC